MYQITDVSPVQLYRIPPSPPPIFLNLPIGLPPFHIPPPPLPPRCFLTGSVVPNAPPVASNFPDVFMHTPPPLYVNVYVKSIINHDEEQLGKKPESVAHATNNFVRRRRIRKNQLREELRYVTNADSMLSAKPQDQKSGNQMSKEFVEEGKVITSKRSSIIEDVISTRHVSNSLTENESVDRQKSSRNIRRKKLRNFLEKRDTEIVHVIPNKKEEKILQTTHSQHPPNRKVETNIFRQNNVHVSRQDKKKYPGRHHRRCLSKEEEKGNFKSKLQAEENFKCAEVIASSIQHSASSIHCARNQDYNALMHQQKTLEETVSYYDCVETVASSIHHKTVDDFTSSMNHQSPENITFLNHYQSAETYASLNQNQSVENYAYAVHHQTVENISSIQHQDAEIFACRMNQEAFTSIHRQAEEDTFRHYQSANASSMYQEAENFTSSIYRKNAENAPSLIHYNGTENCTSFVHQDVENYTSSVHQSAANFFCKSQEATYQQKTEETFGYYQNAEHIASSIHREDADISIHHQDAEIPIHHQATDIFACTRNQEAFASIRQQAAQEAFEYYENSKTIVSTIHQKIYQIADNSSTHHQNAKIFDSEVNQEAPIQPQNTEETSSFYESVENVISAVKVGAASTYLKDAEINQETAIASSTLETEETLNTHIYFNSALQEPIESTVRLGNQIISLYRLQRGIETFDLFVARRRRQNKRTRQILLEEAIEEMCAYKPAASYSSVLQKGLIDSEDTHRFMVKKLEEHYAFKKRQIFLPERLGMTWEELDDMIDTPAVTPSAAPKCKVRSQRSTKSSVRTQRPTLIKSSENVQCSKGYMDTRGFWYPSELVCQHALPKSPTISRFEFTFVRKFGWTEYYVEKGKGSTMQTGSVVWYNIFSRISAIIYDTVIYYVFPATCEEKDPDPGGEQATNDTNNDAASTTSNHTTTSSTTQTSSSEDSSPRSNKGLSRRQRKNRRRDDTSPTDNKKKVKQHLKCSISRKPYPPLVGLVNMLDLREKDLDKVLSGYVLGPNDLISYGYPFELVGHPGKAFIMSRGSKWTTTIIKESKKQVSFDVNAVEFVPKTSGDQEDSEDSATGSDCGEDGQNSPKRLSVSDDEGVITDFQPVGDKRKCCRCSADYWVDSNNEPLFPEECHYHWGRMHNRTKYNCCGGEPGSVGCEVSPGHVWNGLNIGLNALTSFVKTKPRKEQGPYSLLALDCEMVFTCCGFELAKITVVAIDGRQVYDTYVQAVNEVIDYNTRFSGITDKDLDPKRNPSVKSLREVQNDLMGFISAETILCGHGLENDLRALRMIHNNCIDTSIVFPHLYGYPMRRSLKFLSLTVLKKVIQKDGNSHDSCEDAITAMELVLFRVLKDLKPELYVKDYPNFIL